MDKNEGNMNEIESVRRRKKGHDGKQKEEISYTDGRIKGIGENKDKIYKQEEKRIKEIRFILEKEKENGRRERMKGKRE